MPVQKAEAAWAEVLEWLGAKEQETERVSDSAVPQFWGALGTYLHVLLLFWHSKLSNRHSAVLHSSSHWLLMYSQQGSGEEQLAQGSSMVREQSPPSHWQAWLLHTSSQMPSRALSAQYWLRQVAGGVLVGAV